MDELFSRCAYVVALGSKGDRPFKIFCNKMVAPDLSFCPKHTLIAEEEGREAERRSAQPKEKKQRRKDELEALAHSPLTAVNPAFDAKHKTYTEPE